ncbi:hypothetical protein PR048_023766 [Dryococelus australis]|uniref:Uncharacterized protein n=1 Tax=Dryococelus australis TaxID=614101 RepID=A0ABQ9GUZ1_9NEOP|nr:hypothetical protein PR048_023766 [Dryococelus australis]
MQATPVSSGMIPTCENLGAAPPGIDPDPPPNGIVRHDSHMRESGVIRPGTEPGSPWWEASRLTAQPRSTIETIFTSDHFTRGKYHRDPEISWIHLATICTFDAQYDSYITDPETDNNLRLLDAAVAEWLACSPPNKANLVQSPAGSHPDFRMWESCSTMPLVGKFSRGSPVSPYLSFRCCSILTSIIILIGSQDLAQISSPNPHVSTWSVKLLNPVPSLTLPHQSLNSYSSESRQRILLRSSGTLPLNEPARRSAELHNPLEYRLFMSGNGMRKVAPVWLLVLGLMRKTASLLDWEVEVETPRHPGGVTSAAACKHPGLGTTTNPAIPLQSLLATSPGDVNCCVMKLANRRTRIMSGQGEGCRERSMVADRRTVHVAIHCTPFPYPSPVFGDLFPSPPMQSSFSEGCSVQGHATTPLRVFSAIRSPPLHHSKAPVHAPYHRSNTAKTCLMPATPSAYTSPEFTSGGLAPSNTMLHKTYPLPPQGQKAFSDDCPVHRGCCTATAIDFRQHSLPSPYTNQELIFRISRELPGPRSLGPPPFTSTPFPEHTFSDTINVSARNGGLLQGQSMSFYAPLSKLARFHPPDNPSSPPQLSLIIQSLQMSTYMHDNRRESRYFPSSLATPSAPANTQTSSRHTALGITQWVSLACLTSSVFHKHCKTSKTGSSPPQSAPQYAHQAAPQLAPQSAPQSASQSASQSAPQSAPHSASQLTPQSALQSAPHRKAAPQRFIQRFIQSAGVSLCDIMEFQSTFIFPRHYTQYHSLVPSETGWFLEGSSPGCCIPLTKEQGRPSSASEYTCTIALSTSQGVAGFVMRPRGSEVPRFVVSSLFKLFATVGHADGAALKHVATHMCKGFRRIELAPRVKRRGIRHRSDVAPTARSQVSVVAMLWGLPYLSTGSGCACRGADEPQRRNKAGPRHAESTSPREHLKELPPKNAIVSIMFVRARSEPIAVGCASFLRCDVLLVAAVEFARASPHSYAGLARQQWCDRNDATESRLYFLLYDDLLVTAVVFVASALTERCDTTAPRKHSCIFGIEQRWPNRRLPLRQQTTNVHAVDVGIIVHKTAEFSLQVIELANFSSTSNYARCATAHAQIIPLSLLPAPFSPPAITPVTTGHIATCILLPYLPLSIGIFVFARSALPRTVWIAYLPSSVVACDANRSGTSGDTARDSWQTCGHAAIFSSSYFLVPTPIA